MPEGRERRTKILHTRVTPTELAEWREKAKAAGVTPSELLRQSMGRVRVWTAAALREEQELLRQVARIGSNLNQIARWANTHKEAAEAVQVVAHLAAIEREIGELAGRKPPRSGG